MQKGYAIDLETGQVEQVTMTAELISSTGGWVDVVYPDGRSDRLIDGETLFWDERDAWLALQRALVADLERLQVQIADRSAVLFQVRNKCLSQFGGWEYQSAGLESN